MNYPDLKRAEASAKAGAAAQALGLLQMPRAISAQFNMTFWDAETYGGLSDIARAITGTQWSGPRFFGIEQRVRQQPRERESAPISIRPCLLLSAIGRFWRLKPFVSLFPFFRSLQDLHRV